MSTALFPSSTTLPGLDIVIERKPQWSTIVQENVNGMETRVARRAYPRREYGLKFNFLRSAATYNEFQTLEGFFHLREGMFDSFLWTDPDDNTVTGQSIATADGSTRSWLMVRTLGAYSEVVSWVTAINAVYLNGVAQGAAEYQLTTPNSLVWLDYAPANGTAITADFTYAWQVRFSEDTMTFDKLVNLIWENKSVKFISLVANTTVATAPAVLPSLKFNHAANSQYIGMF